MGAGLLADGHRGAAQLVPGGVNALGGEEQHGHRAVDGLLGVADALQQVVLLVDDRRHQLRGVDVPAAHLQKVGVAGLEQGLDDLLGVVDTPHGDDGIGAVVRAHDQGLGLIV